jgi:uncharacterized RDD family membrane protein YckC
MEPQKNPYASPTQTPFAIEAAVAGPLPLASQGQRFVNLIIDSIATWILSTCSGVIIGVVYAFSRANPAAPIEPSDEAYLNLMGYAVGFSVHIGYYIVMEGLTQRTLAKFVTRTRVVKADGSRPSFGQIVGRSFARIIPFEAFSFFGGKGFPVGWHDSLSGTRVIRV